MALKILRIYGTETAGIAHIIHAKITFDSGPPFCNPASGQGHINLPRQNNDGECIPATQAPYMWDVPDKPAFPLSLDLDELQR